MLIQAWAGTDLPLRERADLLGAALVHTNAVVRGYALRQFALAVWKGEAPGVLSEALGRHAAMESRPGLGAVGRWLAQAKAGEALSQKTLDAAMEEVCAGR